MFCLLIRSVYGPSPIVENNAVLLQGSIWSNADQFEVLGLNTLHHIV